jgi:hypothetical protein
MRCAPRRPPTWNPRVLDNKYYVRGVGEVAELSVRGPAEARRLVEISSDRSDG